MIFGPSSSTRAVDGEARRRRRRSRTARRSARGSRSSGSSGGRSPAWSARRPRAGAPASAGARRPSCPTRRGARCRRSDRPALGRRRVVGDRAAAPLAAQLPRVRRRRRRRPARCSSSGRAPARVAAVGAHAVEALERVLGAGSRDARRCSGSSASSTRPARGPGPRGRRSAARSPSRSASMPSSREPLRPRSRAPPREPTRQTMRCTMPGAGPARAWRAGTRRRSARSPGWPCSSA